MTRKDEIIDDICRRFRPLPAGAKEAIRQRLELFVKVCKALSGIRNARAINTAAKRLRELLVLLHEEQQVEHLECFGGLIHEELFSDLLMLEEIWGPAANSDPFKWLAADYARVLIKDFSKLTATNNPNGPLRSISTLIHEYRTGDVCDLENACEAVLKAAGRKSRGSDKC